MNGEWIWVHDRLPEKGVKVLVWDGTCYGIATAEHHEAYTDRHPFLGSYRFGAWTYWGDPYNENNCYTGVECWMPLPEAP